jgi:hypothetical protein
LGTERDEYGSGPCPCGSGTIEVDVCSPDHAWGGGRWFEARLNCHGCRGTYSIYDEFRGEMPKLVLRADIEKREKATAAWHAKRREIEATPQFQFAKAKIDQLVSKQPSMAAKYRVLQTAGLADRSLASFRKHPAYVVDATRVAHASRSLGFADANLDKMTEELEKIWHESRFDPPAIQTGVAGLEM